jgi:hypothetical protein
MLKVVEIKSSEGRKRQEQSAYGCHRSRYPETCVSGFADAAQVCEYADLWHPN